jgi:hypothetical protein
MSDRVVQRLLGSPVAAERAVAGGYTHASRRIVTLADGRTAFVKTAVDELTLGWLRNEHRIYSSLEGAFMPRMLGWEEPVLVLEDLSDGHWPPPWRDGDVEAVKRALAELHAVAPLPGLPKPEEQDDLRGGWATVAADPEPFLGLELCSRAWLAGSLPALLAASARAQLDGDSILHLDVRSDNLCLRDGRCVLVDWNYTSRGNPVLDVAWWLPSLQLEGGPDLEPSTELADLAAVFAGYLACRAGLPEPARGVRDIQKAQLEITLPWAADSLGLSRPRPR